MRNNLTKLPHLRKLAFSRDSYVKGRPRIPIHNHYYEHLVIGAATTDYMDDNDRLWQLEHKERRLEEANKYVVMMPNLEWLYFGKMRTQALETANEGSRRAFPLHEGLEDGWRILREMFGGETHD